MRIPGWKTLNQSTRWLRSRFIEGVLILGYHRLAGTSPDSYSLGVTPQHFAEQLQILRQCACPISLKDLVRGLQQRSLPKRAVALTFDDGYADILYQAKPLLERYEIPATLFVATGYIGGEFWWDELERVLLSPAILPESLCLSINGGIYEWTSSDIAQNKLETEKSDPRHHLLLSLYQRLLPLSAREQWEVLDQLWSWAGTGRDDQPSYRVLTAEELVELSVGGLVEIGAHTVTHPILATLPVAAQQSEIQQSKICLEKLLGRPVTSFSYPNGSLSEATLTIVRESGFICACASYDDIAWRGSNLFRLPRFWIPNWNGATFSGWLQRWLHG